MDERVKYIFKAAVITGTLRLVRNTLTRHELVKDDSFFDYELLKEALKRKHIGLVYYLIYNGCRVKNTSADNTEEETALCLAIKLGNSGIIKRMLLQGASIDDKNIIGDTELYAAFKGGFSNGVNAALTFFSKDKCVDSTTVDSIRHFQIACITDHCDAVQYFLKYGFDVNSRLILNSDKFVGINALHYAAAEKLSQTLIVLLLENGGDLSLKSSYGKTLLHIIYYSGFSVRNKSLIEEVFRRGNHTKFRNSVDNNGVSHFHICCAINYFEYAQIFIDRGVDVNKSISSSCTLYPGYTPLLIAVSQGCDRVVKLLLENGADANIKSTSGTAPLHLACNLNDMVKSTIVQLLLTHNANSTAEDENKCTPLHLAFKQSDIYYKLISRIPTTVNYTNNEGLSHFHIVCIRNNMSAVQEFLHSGVDVDSVTTSGNNSGYTALHFAVLHKHKDVVEELLKWKAKVNIRSKDFQLTPLHLACNFNPIKFHEVNVKANKSANSLWISNSKSQLYIINLLLLKGADVNAEDSYGRTPLLQIFTIHPGYSERHFSEINETIRKITEILVSNKANINGTTNGQDSILHIVSGSRYLNESRELVEYLLSKGINLHAVNMSGFTPLHIAVNFSKLWLINIFLKHGADVNAKSKDGLIPLQMIIIKMRYSYMPFIRYSSHDIMCTLLENGSSVNVRGTSTKSFLQSAIESQNTFAITILLEYGADINMEDGNDNSTLCFLVSEDNWISKRTFVMICQIIFIHIQKLRALGLYVSEKVQMRCSELRKKYDTIFSTDSSIRNVIDNINFVNVFDNCLEELEKMKLIKIDNYTSLYNVLLKDKHAMTTHVRNRTFVEILDDPKVNNNFPLYNYLLKLKYKSGLKRREVLQFANAALHNTIKFNLPDFCYDSILKNLSNEDIINLKVNQYNKKRKRRNDD